MANGILVVLEHNHGKIGRSSREALVAAQKIGGELGEGVSAIVLAKDADAIASQVSETKIDKLYTVSDDRLENYTPDGYTHALTQTIETISPNYLFFAHTYQVRDFAPKLAAKSGGSMISDCVGHRVENSQLILTRQIFAGKFNADYSFTSDGLKLVSFQAGAFNADDLEPGSATVENLPVDFGGVDIRTEVLEIFQGVKQEVDLTKAEVIVSAGRGLKEKDNLYLVEELAEALGGEVSGSRPVCDDGWMGIDRQIGSSGQTVAPKLYLSLGISGAIQHVVGMKSSKYIVAINKDPHAPIFELADVAVIADLFEVVPDLTKAIQEAKN